MTVLVTGGAGYIGSHMVLNLADAGEKVVVLDNLVTAIFPGAKAVRELGEIYLHDAGQRKLPLGTFCRFAN